MNQTFAGVGSGFGSRGLIPGLANVSNVIQGIPQIGNLARALISPLTEAAEEGLRFNMLIESAALGFEGVTGGAQQSARYVKQLTDFAAANPIFNTQGTIRAARQMAVFGFETQKTTEYLKIWGGALAQGGQFNDENLQGVVRAFGQIRSLGRVTSEDVNMLQDRGIPAWELLAKAIGKTVAETRKLGELGKLKGGPAVEAITAMLQTDPRFAGGADKFAKGLEGRLAQLQDLREVAQGQGTQQLAADLNKSLEDALTGNLPALTQKMAEGFNAALTPVGAMMKASVSATIGGGITGGLQEGINAGTAMVAQTVTAFSLNAVLKPFKDYFGMNSPSRVMIEQGRFLAFGLAQGIQEGTSAVQVETIELARKIEEIIKKRAAVRTAIDEAKRDMSRAGNMPNYLPPRRQYDTRPLGSLDSVQAPEQVPVLPPEHEAANRQRQALWQGARQRVAAFEAELKSLETQLSQLSDQLGRAVQAAGAFRSLPSTERPRDARREREARGITGAATPDDNYYVRPVLRGVAPQQWLPTSDLSALNGISLMPAMQEVPRVLATAVTLTQQAAAGTRDWYKEVVDLNSETGRFGITAQGASQAFRDAFTGSFTQIGASFKDMTRGFAIDFATSIQQMLASYASSQLSNIFGKFFTTFASNLFGGAVSGAATQGGSFAGSGMGSTTVFGGSRDVGGPMDAGKIYKVHRDEFIVPLQDSYAYNPQQSRQMARQAQGGPPVININIVQPPIPAPSFTYRRSQREGAELLAGAISNRLRR
ncbi:MAG TPA: tape measure protein [Pyrinomonadaceae bacterium]|nr:tape measure protein [Pyrinomonadaceae bacterium]